MDFTKYMAENYDLDELKAITEQGCASGCAGTMIYYSQTTTLYDKYAKELHDILATDIENFSECPKYITDALAGGVETFKNAMVWYCAETVAMDLVNEAEETKQ